jgi:CheY-like chemotaxis protein
VNTTPATPSPPTTPVGLLLCDDLLFASRILAVARAHHCALTWVREPQALLTAARQQIPGGILIDLHHPQLHLPQLLAQLLPLCPTPPRLVAFGSHVDTSRLKAATDAGCHHVLPRSRFVALLETQLPHWLTPPADPTTGPAPA